MYIQQEMWEATIDEDSDNDVQESQSMQRLDFFADLFVAWNLFR